MKRVVISGLGVVSSLGNTVEDVTSALKQGKSGCRRDESHIAHKFRSHVSAPPPALAEAKIDRKIKRFMDLGGVWAYTAMQQAITDSRLDEKLLHHPRTGLIAGSGGSSTESIVASAATIKERGPRALGTTAVPKSMSSYLSAVLGVAFGIKGLQYTISSACATSTHCIGAAYEQIQLGKQDIVFAGGGESLHWTTSGLFDGMGALARKFNERPEVASRAYDAGRDGFVIAGGAGIVVVESRDSALRRGAPIYGEILGYGANSDGVDMVVPSGEGALRCMQMALAPVERKITYINAHGTSTKIGDLREVQAIEKLFGSDSMPYISSTKSLSGHSLGAAGVHEVIFSLLMLKHNFLAASAHIETLDPDFAHVPILRERLDDAGIDCLMSNSFGFGGTNACLIIGNPA